MLFLNVLLSILMMLFSNAKTPPLPAAVLWLNVLLMIETLAFLMHPTPPVLLHTVEPDAELCKNVLVTNVVNMCTLVPR